VSQLGEFWSASSRFRVVSPPVLNFDTNQQYPTYFVVIGFCGDWGGSRVLVSQRTEGVPAFCKIVLNSAKTCTGTCIDIPSHEFQKEARKA
jgi:hypothetical protein